MIMLIPTTNNPYFSNPVSKNVRKPLYRSLFDFSTSLGIVEEFSNKK